MLVIKDDREDDSKDRFQTQEHAADGIARLATRNRKAMIKDAEKASAASFPMANVLPQRTAVINRAILAVVDFFMSILFLLYCSNA